MDCWGFDGDGELGNRSSSRRIGYLGGGGYDTPQAVIGITNAISVTSDEDGSYCAVLSSGGMDCWGWNDEASWAAGP